MKQYLENLTHILNNGVECEDRTGTGTLSVFGTQLRFDLSEGFPLLTTKKLHIKSIFCELLWFLKGSTNAESLQQMSVRIWNEWALKEDITEEVLMSPPDRLQYTVKHNKFEGTEDQLRKILNVKGENLGMIYLDTLGVPRTRTVILRKKGDLGPIYGKQWRKWSSRDPEQDYRIIDQVAEVIESIKTNPYSRRHIVTAWNVADLDKMALPPCHLMFQFYVRNGKLSCHLLMRSQDYFLGVPYNIASYALLTHMIAMVTNLEVGELLINGVDSHIYVDHIEQVKEQLTRDVRPLPKLVIKRKVDNIDDFTLEDFEVVDYDPHPHIAGKVSV